MNQYTVFPLPLVFSSSEWSHSNTTKDFNVSLFAISVAIELKGRKWWTQKQSIKKKKKNWNTYVAIINANVLSILDTHCWILNLHVGLVWLGCNFLFRNLRGGELKNCWDLFNTTFFDRLKTQISTWPGFEPKVLIATRLSI